MESNTVLWVAVNFEDCGRDLNVATIALETSLKPFKSCFFNRHLGFTT